MNSDVLPQRDVVDAGDRRVGVESILSLSVRDLAESVRAGRLAAVEVARAYLDRVESSEPRVHAYLHVARERALHEAAAVDAARARGEPLGPLAGVPYALKDSLVTADLPTTAGSRILAGWVPPYDATVVRRLRAAGAVLLGKLALDEFAMGTTGEHSPFPVARNPWAPGRVAGGSSSGSAAAVAARSAAFALGSDTGGSIRLPAAHCGVVGVRPTWGRVSRAGLVAFASSLDTVGPLARDVADAALVMGCLSGHDPGDSTSLTAPWRATAGGLAGMTIGVDRRLADLDPDVAALFERALATLTAAGATIVDVALPDPDEALAAYAALTCAEAASNLARYDGVRFGLHVPRDSFEATAAATRAAGFGAEVKRRIILGTHLQRTPDLLARARATRSRIAATLADALTRCDVLAGPTARAPAPLQQRHVSGDSRDQVLAAGREHHVRGDSRDRFLAGGLEQHVRGDSRDRLLAADRQHVSGDSRDRLLAGGLDQHGSGDRRDAVPEQPVPGDIHDPDADRFLVAAALAGLPALSVPCGLTHATPTRPALPVGLHLVAPRLADERLLALAAAYEAARGPLEAAP